MIFIVVSTYIYLPHIIINYTYLHTRTVAFFDLCIHLLLQHGWATQHSHIFFSYICTIYTSSLKANIIYFALCCISLLSIHFQDLILNSRLFIYKSLSLGFSVMLIFHSRIADGKQNIPYTYIKVRKIYYPILQWGRKCSTCFLVMLTFQGSFG